MLIEKKLAACVNMISPVHSCYIWKGKSYLEDEVLLVVKTRAGLFEAELVPAVKAMHPTTSLRLSPCRSSWAPKATWTGSAR
jgi:periplasmic divalent cation tolerance protein